MYKTIFDDLYRINREFNRLFKSGYNSGRSYYWPEINLYENSFEYVVVTKVPGIKKEDIAITLKDNTLKISGEKKGIGDEVNFHIRERKRGKFERNVMLEEKIEAEKIAAEIKNGFLLVKIPKAPEAKPFSIEIK